MKPKRKGNISEAKILARLVELEIPVAIPFGDNEPYDLIIERDNKLLKVQCKTATIKEDIVISYLLSRRMNTKKQYKTSYKGRCDIFLIYCHDNDKIYEISVDEAAVSSVKLRLAEPKCKNKERTRYAKDYEL